MTTYIYKLLFFADVQMEPVSELTNRPTASNIETKLNELAKDGWRVVGYSHRNYHCFLMEKLTQTGRR